MFKNVFWVDRKYINEIFSDFMKEYNLQIYMDDIILFSVTWKEDMVFPQESMAFNTSFCLNKVFVNLKEISTKIWKKLFTTTVEFV